MYPDIFFKIVSLKMNYAIIVLYRDVGDKY